MTEKEYNEAPGIRRSDLWRINDSPEKFKWFLEHPEEPGPAFLFGQAAHKMVLEPEDFYEEFAVMPAVDRRTKEGKKQYDEFREMSAGRGVISQDDFVVIAEMSAVLSRNELVCRYMFENTGTEVPFFWTDPETGEKCKVKCDKVKLFAHPDGTEEVVVVDYKTAGTADTAAFNRALFKYGYHVQAAMYTEGVQICNKLPVRPRFVFVVQEKKAPYSVNVIEVSQEVMNCGDAVFHRLLNLYHGCAELDDWPGYNADGVNETEMPGYIEAGEEE